MIEEFLEARLQLRASRVALQAIRRDHALSSKGEFASAGLLLAQVRTLRLELKANVMGD